MEKTNVVFQKIENCLDCNFHKLIPDPDPNDWFCDDDESVVCTKTLNPDRNDHSEYASDRNVNRSITCSSRPYQTRRDCAVPDWCPLLGKK